MCVCVCVYQYFSFGFLEFKNGVNNVVVVVVVLCSRFESRKLKTSSPHSKSSSPFHQLRSVSLLASVNISQDFWEF